MEKQQKMSYRDELQAMMRAKEEQKKAEKERRRQEDMALVRPEEFVPPRGGRGGVYQPFNNQPPPPQPPPQPQPPSFASPSFQYGGMGGNPYQEPAPPQWQDNNNFNGGMMPQHRQPMNNEHGATPMDEKVGPSVYPRRWSDRFDL